MGLFNRNNTTGQADASHDGTHNCRSKSYLAAIVTTYTNSPDEPGALRTRDCKCGTCGRVLETVVLD
jgi:hypothetical protein